MADNLKPWVIFGLSATKTCQITKMFALSDSLVSCLLLVKIWIATHLVYEYYVVISLICVKNVEYSVENAYFFDSTLNHKYLSITMKIPQGSFGFVSGQCKDLKTYCHSVC